MDHSDNTNASNRSALRQPFIDTANALAFFYKQAAVAERDARDAGSRAAYQRIIQWAALKSRSADPVSAADVISFCAAELAQLPTHSPPSAERTAPAAAPLPTAAAGTPVSRTDADMPHCDAPAVAYVPRDDALVSDIKKLHVNPRKRQRVDLSDAFIRACDEENSFMFAADHPHALSNHDSNSSLLGQNGLLGMQHNALQSKKDVKDTHSSANEYISRKPRHPKSHVYDKHKRK